MIRYVTEKTRLAAQNRYAVWILAAWSFLESSIFPIPPDAMLAPMVYLNRARAWFLAAVTAISSVLGGIAGYVIGFYAFDLIALPILESLGKEKYFDQFRIYFQDYGSWAVLVAGVTPFPFKVATILAGSFQLNLAVFVISATIARFMRFFLVAAVVWKFGPLAAKALSSKWAWLVTVLLFGALVLVVASR